MALEFKRDKTDILITSDQSGLMITAVWTVVISKESCIDYVNNYNKDFENGFVETNTGAPAILLIHGPARFKMSNDEAADLIQYIQETFM